MKGVIAGLSLVLMAASAMAQSFDGYDCVDDCSGHRAGFEWGRDNNVQSESDCYGGNSSSFAEGCQVYLQNPGHDPEYDDDGNEIPD